MFDGGKHAGELRGASFVVVFTVGLLAPLVFAAALIVGAGLKLDAARVSEALGVDHPITPDSNVLQAKEWVTAICIFELSLATLLIVGWWDSVVRWLSILTLCLFLAYSILQVVAGSHSCGCFGTVVVSPWAVMAFDSTMIVVFYFIRPRSIGNFLSARIRMGLGGICVAALLSIVIWVEARPLNLATWSGDGSIQFAAGDRVVLTPERWVGRPFPLWNAFERSQEELGAPLRSGSWIVLFIHAGCPKCENELLSLLGDNTTVNADRGSVAIIEVPSRVPARRFPGDSEVPRIRLRRDVVWYIETPVRVYLKNGMVVPTHISPGAGETSDFEPFSASN